MAHNNVFQEALSLDEYIRMKKIEDQFCLLNHRKRTVDISQDVLDMDLDAYVRDAGVEEERPVQQTSGTSKFDRRSMRGEASSDDDEDEEIAKKNDLQDEDVDMNGKYKTLDTIDEGEAGLKGLFNFSTVESQQGIRVPSQQWRMLPENLLDRPKGVKRLEFLPLDEAQRYRNDRFGKIRKNRNKNRSRTSSFSSCASDATTGSFVEKGKFTYKFGDRNRDEGIIGIERAKRFDAPDPPVAHGTTAAPININMNWDGFFTGFTEAVAKVQKFTPAPTEPAPSELTSATERLLALLQGQRDQKTLQKYNMEIQKEISQIQGRPPLVFVDHGDGRQDVMASSGSGISDFQGTTHTSSMPMNIRFA